MSNRDHDHNVVFRCPAPSVPVRGSGAKGTHKKYNWKDHLDIKVWFDGQTRGKKKKAIGFKQLRAVAFARFMNTHLHTHTHTHTHTNAHPLAHA